MKAHVGSVAIRGTSSWNQKLRRNLHQQIKTNLKPYRRFIGLTAYQDLRFLFCTYFSLSLTPYIMGCWGTLVKKTCLKNKPFCLQNIVNKIKDFQGIFNTAGQFSIHWARDVQIWHRYQKKFCLLFNID